MRAQHQAWQARNLAFIPAADISNRVEMRAHSGLDHPAQDQVGRRAVLWGQENACEVVGGLGNRPQPVDPADNLIAKR